MKANSQHTPFFIALALFILYKVTHLTTGFFWDEMWVYAPAVQFMADAGPTLLPGSLDAYYSKGHPLMFHFLAGLWAKVFGYSHLAMHTFPLVVSVIYLALLYCVVFRFAGYAAGSIVTIGLMCQSVFVSQASMVLPEIMVGLFLLLAIVAFAKGRVGWYLFGATACIMTKESGLIIIPTLVVLRLLLCLDYRIEWQRAVWKDLLIISAPLPVYLLFLVYQKEVSGWYFYPDHLGYIVSDVQQILGNARRNLAFCVGDQARAWWAIAVLVMVLYTAYQRNIWSASLLLTAIGAMVVPLPMVQNGAFIMSYLAIMLMIYHSALGSDSKLLVYLLISMWYSYITFYAFNFTTVRYFVGVIAFPAAASAVYVIYHWQYKLAYLLLPATLLTAISLQYTVHHQRVHTVSDVTMAHVKVNAAMGEMVQYVEALDIYDQYVYANFLMEHALSMPYTGYRTTGLPFTKFNDYGNRPSTYYVILDSASDQSYLDHRASPRSELLHSIQDGTFTVELFKVTQ